MTENRYLTVLLTGDIKDTVTNEFLRGSGIARRLNELHEENEQSKMMIATLRNIVLENENLEKENNDLKEKNKFIFKQIKAFRDDCVIYTDFAGASTLNRLLDILDEGMEIWE